MVGKSMNVEEEAMDMSNVPELPQRQDSTYEQLKDLYVVANKLGMYDAADSVKVRLDRIESNLRWLDDVMGDADRG